MLILPIYDSLRSGSSLSAVATTYWPYSPFDQQLQRGVLAPLHRSEWFLFTTWRSFSLASAPRTYHRRFESRVSHSAHSNALFDLLAQNQEQRELGLSAVAIKPHLRGSAQCCFFLPVGILSAGGSMVHRSGGMINVSTVFTMNMRFTLIYWFMALLCIIVKDSGA